MTSLDRGDIKLAYDRSVAHDVPDVAEMLLKLAERVGELEERRCEICGYAEHHREHTGCLRRQLAESQAREAKLREALSIAVVGGDYLASEREQFDKLLATKPDDTALRELIAKAGEVMRERCADECEAAASDDNKYDIALKIRTLHGVTLEDLQK